MSALASPDTARAYVALGGNLGEVLLNFERALDLLAERVEVCKVAPAYRTVAMMPPGRTGRDPDFWNSVAEIETSLPPRLLLELLLEIEGRLGRERTGRWRARTLDLDLLLYGCQATALPGLQVPHPGLASRLFVLRPLCDIAPEATLPDGSSARELLARHADPDVGILERFAEWGRKGRSSVTAGAASTAGAGSRARPGR